MKEPGDVIEVVKKISCYFPLLCVAYVATDAILSLECDMLTEEEKYCRSFFLPKRNDGLEVKHIGLEAKCSGLEVKRSGLEAKCSGLEAKRNGLEAKRSGLEAKRSGLEAKRSVI
ncbi:hypothetical protein Tco_0529413 [Tanacetum coccineum]